MASTGTRDRNEREGEGERGNLDLEGNSRSRGIRTDLNTKTNANARSTDTSQLRLDTPNANIEVREGENIYTSGQNPNPGTRINSGSGSASEIASGRGSQKIKERKRQRIDSILKEARCRKVMMDNGSGDGDGDEGASCAKAGNGNESQSSDRRGYTTGNGNGNGTEHTNGRESRGESSADEETSVLRRRSDINYGGVGVGITTSTTADTNNGHNSMKRKFETNDPNKRGGLLGTGRGRVFSGTEAEREPNNSRRVNSDDIGENEHRGKERGRIGKWWKRMVEEYGSIELENKGSVARDHLALERTFLAWLRTSLAFASIGIAITQLFRLNTSSSSTSPPLDPSDPRNHLRHLGKPLGATFVGISILMLSVGFHRYFEGQFYIIRGKFPASRGSIALVALITGLLMVTSLVVVVVGNRGGWEK